MTYNTHKMVTTTLLLLTLLSVSCSATTVLNAGNPDAKRLYDDLLSNYNKLVRPVVNTTDPLTVRIKLKLSQLIDVVSFLSQPVREKPLRSLKRAKEDF